MIAPSANARTLDVSLSREKLPGNAKVSAHSVYSALEVARSIETFERIDGPITWSADDRSEASLDGLWRRRAYDRDPEEPVVDPSLDDYDWPMVSVPDNFGLEPGLSMQFGPVYYRKRIAPLASPHTRIVFDSVDYLAEVHLDGERLGSHEGYFCPFAFDVTSKVKSGSVLVVRAQDPFEEYDPSLPFFVHLKRAIKGTLKFHDSRPGGLPDCSTPGWSGRIAQSLTTGGIPGSVRLEGTGAVRCDGVFVTPLAEREGRVHLAVVLTNLDRATKATGLLLRLTRPGDTEPSQSVALQLRLPPGAHRLDLEARIADPMLWWPVSERDQGPSVLYSLAVDVVDGDRRSDHRAVRFGLRTARIEGEPKRFLVNDVSVFIKAANYIPYQHFSKTDKEHYRKDMQLAAAGHLNSFGVHAHLQPPRCYDAADEEGFLLFQDFPLQWGYASGTANNPGFIDIAERQIAEMAYLHWNHPSVVYWACHNEPAAMFIPGQPPDPALDLDNQVLDEHLERQLRSVDPKRHIHRASGIGDDLHLYDGSIGGGDVYGVRNHESWFVSEFGFWTVGERFHRWNDRVWPPDERELREWMSRLSFGPQTMMFSGFPARYPTADAFRLSTELYGAFLAKYQTEWFRIRRGEPFAAYRWHFWNDWWGYAGGGLVDKDRVPKATYRALAAASRPLLVTTSLPQTIVRPGSTVTFPIHVISDLRQAREIAIRYRWVRTDASVVIGADEEVTQRIPMMVLPTPRSMVAMPYGSRSCVIEEGEISTRAEPEASSLAGEVTVEVPSEPLVGYTLELAWDEETNSFHVFTAPEEWFPGPGAFVVERREIRRLGT